MPEEFYYGTPTTETFPEPDAPEIFDADGVCWTRYGDLGWMVAGDARAQKWADIQKWGPFTE